MSETCNCSWHPPTDQWLDSLALCWLLGIGDSTGFETILASYAHDTDALIGLIFAMAHTSIDAMNALAIATGRTSDAILGTAREWIVNHGD